MKFGVIGWGLRGKVASLAHDPEKGNTLSALADPSEEARGRFLEEYPDGQAFADFKELLNLGLDAVFITSPDGLHVEHAVPFLERGTPVFLEKPMAITVEGCDEIIAAAERGNAKLYVGHNMRHFAVVQKMKEWIDQGLIGEVKLAWCRHFVSYGGDAYFRDWHADRSLSGGLLLQKGAHDIDVLHWLCGGFSQEVVGMGDLMVYGDIQDRQKPGEPVKVEFRKVWPPTALDKLNPVVDVEDANMIMMRLDNGVMASYQQCHFTPDAWRNYTVIGTKGRIENFGDAPGKAVIRMWDHARYEHDPEGDLIYRVPEDDGWHGGSDKRMVAEFLRFVETGAETLTSVKAARMAVVAGLAGTESVRSGSRPVRVQ